MKRWVAEILLLLAAVVIFVSLTPFLYERAQIAVEKERPRFKENILKLKEKIERENR